MQLSNSVFQRKYKFDPTNERYVRKLFTDQVFREMVGSNDVVSEIELEWEALCRDRESLRQIFPTGNNKVVLPCNLERMIWNAQKIFHINKRHLSDLSPLKVIRGVRDLIEKCVVVRGEDKLSKQANDNATTLFQV